MCGFKTHPCVPAKRPHVEQNRAFCRYTRMRFEPTHGDVFNLHTVRREGGVVCGRGFSSLSLPFSLSLFRGSLSLLSFSSLFPLLPSLSPISATMTMITRPVGPLSLCTLGSDLPESECLYFGSFPVWPNLFVSCNCASLVPLGMKWAALCWKWVMCLCLFVFGCVW